MSFRKKLLPVFLLVLLCVVCVSCGDEPEEIVFTHEFRFINEFPDGNESEKYEMISDQAIMLDGQFCEMVTSGQNESGRNELGYPALIYSPNYILRANSDDGSITTIELADLDAEEDYILSGKKEAERAERQDESASSEAGGLIERSESDIEDDETYNLISSGGIWLSNMACLPDGGYICYGNIHVNIIGTQNLGKADCGRRLIRYSADGKVVKFVRVNELDEDLNAGLSGNQYLFAYSDGLLYMVTLDGNVFVINEDLNLVTKFALPEEQAAALAENSVEYKAFLTTDKDGKMVFVCGVTVNGQKKYACYPLSEEGLGEQLELPDTGSRKPILANGYDVYYSDSIGLYGMNNGDKESTILFRWVDVDLASSDIFYMRMESPEKIYVMTRDNKVGVIVSGDNVLTGKTIIRLAYEEDSYFTYSALAIAEKVRAFNLESDKYRVELVAYNTDDVSTANEKLLRDMVSKKIPEIILFTLTITPEDFIKAGALADLYKFMDKDDKYTRDAFVPCVLEPMETGGELPYLTVEYGFSTLAGKESVLGNMTSWTIDDLDDFVSGIGKGEYLTYTSDSDGKAAMLDMLLPMMLNSFIDYDKGKCKFDESFSKLLEICNTAPVKTDFTGFTNPKDFDDGELKIIRLGDKNYLMTKVNQVKSFGQTAVTRIGYPQSGDVSEGIVIYRGMSLGISKRSKKRDAAWEFLRWYLDDQLEDCKEYIEKPQGAISVSYVPTREAMDVVIDVLNRMTVACIPMMKTENGETFISSYIYKTIYYDRTDKAEEHYQIDCRSVIASGGTIVKMDESDVATVNHLLENVNILRSTDTATMGIIKEEASAYFAGVQTLERTVKIITNRVQTRLSE